MSTFVAASVPEPCFALQNTATRSQPYFALPKTGTPQPCFVLQNSATRCTALPNTAIDFGHSIKLRWLLVATAGIVTLVFFIAGHDLLTSRAVGYTQTAEEMQAAAMGGNFARRVAFFALAGWGLVLAFMGKRPLKINWQLTSVLAALAALATASLLWTDEPELCFRRLLVLFCCCLAAAGVARAFSLREMGWLIILIVGSLAAIGLAVEVLLGTFRPWSADYRFAGTVHPNTQGPALAALCVAVLAVVKDSGRFRPLLWLLFAAGVLLLLLTKSRTAAAALIAALVAIQSVKLPLRMQLIGAVAAAWLGAAVLLMICLGGLDPLTDFRDLLLLGRSQEAESLSGRAFIWPEIVQYARERFWLGYGYEAFWTSARIEDISADLGWGLREAHNGYLEMWLWLGIVGVAALLLAEVSALVAALSAFRQTNNQAYLLPLGLLIFGLCDSCLESGVVVISLVPFFLGCCVMRLAACAETVNAPLIGANVK